MSKYTFDCFVCDEHLETVELSEVIAFGNKHKDCDFGSES